MHVDLSSAQRECLEKVQDAVRGKIHPNYNTVFNILRFCQHANFDANIAAFQLEQHLRFREDFNLDEGECLLKEDVVARECTPTSIIGRNRIDGDHLVIIDRSGLVDIANLLKSIEITSYMHQRFRLMERLFKLMNEIEQEKGKQAYVYYIFDLTGLKYNSMIIPFMKGPFKNMWIEIARHYREWIKSFIVVNAPTYLNMLSSILLPLIPDDNFKKRLIFANGNGSEQLLKLIDAECLPELYGGKADNSVVDEPKEIPSSFFWKPKNDYPHPDDLESISIPAGKQRIFTFELHSESCILHAYLMHEDTIATGVNYTSSAKDADTKCFLPEFVRAGTSSMDHFTIRMRSAGYYQLYFANNTSWLFPSTVRYRFSFQSFDDKNAEVLLHENIATTKHHRKKSHGLYDSE